VNNFNKPIAASIEDRVTSSYPISIATSLALESIFEPRTEPYDKSRVIPQHIDLANYDDVYVNIYTLFRNISISVKREVFSDTSNEKIAMALLTEMDVIDSLFSIEGHNIIKPTFYSFSYKSLYNDMKKGIVRIRPDKTPFQIMFKDKYIKTLQLIKKHRDINDYDSEILPENTTRAIVITHIPVDLLSYKNFKTLDLLESNTGKLKTRVLWNSKYARISGRNLSILPFNKTFLYIFGDKTIISPSPIKLRKTILDTAESRRWTPATTMEKVILDLKLDVKEPYILDFIKSI